jgi:hypothetical protein
MNPTTIEELINEPGWAERFGVAHYQLAWRPNIALAVDGSTVAIVEHDRCILTSATHTTEAAAVRAALDIVSALTPR